MDGRQLARIARPTLEAPWVECQLPGTRPPVVVVQFQPQRYVVRTLVFLDGVSLNDGMTLEAWRLKQPLPLDRFEQAFRSRLWGPVGALLIGVVCALPGLVQFDRTAGLLWAVLAAGGFAVSTGWMLTMIAFTRWLRTRRTWSWRLRRALVLLGVMLGLPALLLLGAQVLYLIEYRS